MSPPTPSRDRASLTRRRCAGAAGPFPTYVPREHDAELAGVVTGDRGRVAAGSRCWWAGVVHGQDPGVLGGAEGCCGNQDTAVAAVASDRPVPAAAAVWPASSVGTSCPGHQTGVPAYVPLDQTSGLAPPLASFSARHLLTHSSTALRLSCQLAPPGCRGNFATMSAVNARSIGEGAPPGITPASSRCQESRSRERRSG